jgi:hypothetical protein
LGVVGFNPGVKPRDSRLDRLYIPLFLRYVDDEASYTDGPVRVDGS